MKLFNAKINAKNVIITFMVTVFFVSFDSSNTFVWYVYVLSFDIHRD